MGKPALQQLLLGATPLALALALGPGASGEARAQSPDCGVIGPAANAVCANPELLDLSHELLDAVRELIRVSPIENRPAVMSNHRDWSIGLRRCLGGPPAYECLYRAYEDRISDVGAALSGQIATVDPSFREGYVEPGAVEQGSLPPPPGGTQSDIYARAPSGLGPPQADTAVPGDPAAPTAAPEGGDAASPAAGARVPEAAEAPLAEPPGEEASGEGASGGEAGELRTAAVGAAATAPGDLSGPASILTANVWKAEIATGVRPGTIFVFHADGGLVTADCVESYKLGTWRIAENSLILSEGGGGEETAEIVSIQDSFVRLQIGGGDAPGRSLVLRPAVGPFSCQAG